MDEEKREKGRKEMGGDDSVSRRKFIKKMAYAAPVVITFIASEAYATKITPCRPSQCHPLCQPVPCRPHKPCPPDKPWPPRPPRP